MVGGQCLVVCNAQASPEQKSMFLLLVASKDDSIEGTDVHIQVTVTSVS